MDELRPIYLNNAATSWPKAPTVSDAVAAALTSMPGSANRGGLRDFDVFDAVRRRLSVRLGVADHRRIALGNNSTWALNLAIFGMDLQAGDTVLSTKAEHNSVLRPLHALSTRGVSVVLLDCAPDGSIPPVAWKDAISRFHPRLAVFSHASNVTGAVNDAALLAGIARDGGAVTLLDASQTCGWIPIQADAWGVDMVAVTGHKYLLGPQGTGALYVRPSLRLASHLHGGTGIYGDLEDMPEQMPLHLEAGTGNEPGFYGLLAAMDWADKHPADRAAIDALTDELRCGLACAKARVVFPSGPSTPVVSFDLPGTALEDAFFILTESYDIICRSGLHCAPKILPCIDRPGGTIRFSLSRFTTREEVNAAISAVEDIVHAL